MRVPALFLGLLVFLLSAGPSPTVAATTSVSPRPQTWVKDWPSPDLSQLELGVQQHIRQDLGSLRDLLAETGSSAKAAADIWGSAGKLLHSYELGNYARTCYEYAGQLDPDDYRWPYYLARLYHVDAYTPDALSKAVDNYNRALDLRPADRASHLGLADVYLRLQRLPEAEQSYHLVLGAFPDDAVALAGMGRIHLLRDEPEKAAEYFQRALTKQPAANRIHYLLGQAYRSLGKRELARSHLQEAGKQDPLSPDPLLADLVKLRKGVELQLLTGMKAVKAGQYELAARFFRKALEQAPEDPRVLGNLGSTLVMLDQVDEARTLYQTVVRVAPEFPLGHYNFAALLAGTGDDRAAIPEFQASLSLNPDHVASHLGLAHALMRQNEVPAALGHYDRVLELDPRHREARYWSVMARIHQQQHHEALDLLESVYRYSENPALQHVHARLLAASTWRQDRDGKRALALMEPLFRQRPTLLHGETLAMALAETGDYAAAVKLQQRILSNAEAKGMNGRITFLDNNLRHYRDGMSAETPWPTDSPDFYPPRRLR